MKLRVPFFHNSSSSAQHQSHRFSSSPCGCGRMRKQSSRRKNDASPSVKLSFHQIRELEEAFNVFDLNRDGQISVEELGSVLRSLGDDPTELEVQQMVQEADRNGDGLINLDEFLVLHSSTEGRLVNLEELREAFRFFDANKDGYISAQELYGAMTRIGKRCSVNDCRKMIRGVDTDGDGHVSFEEFQKMMASDSLYY